jgi:D-alanyl-D-alanine carboxypeptidase
MDPAATSPYSVTGTRQNMGSITKLYVATMIMQLVEEGTLSLADTIDAWVDVPAAERITVRMLLEHTSGLRDCLDNMSQEERRRSWTPEALVQRAVSLGAVAEPGGRYSRYSNTNFVILTMILEALSGQTWTDRLASRITSRLGLVATASTTTPGGRMGVAPGWMSVNGRWVNTLELADPSTGWGGGALASTNDEMMAFTRAFFAGELFQKRSTLDQMLSFAHEVDPAMLKGQPPTRIGLAVHRFEIQDVLLVGHLGHRLGYDAAVLRDPATEALIVVTTNTEVTGAAGLIAYDIARYLRAQ